jgi:hypothetical protein
MTPEHLQNDVLGAYPRWQPTDQADPEDPGHSQPDRFPGDGPRHVDAADADCQHADRAGRARVTVGPSQAPSRPSETLHVGGMRHAISWLRIPEAEPTSGRPEELVVLRVLAVGLQQVVVYVLDRHLGGGSTDAECLQFEHDQCPTRIGRQRLVDEDADLVTGRHFA